ncbi:MAG: hypothetical protein NVS4B12_05010 [Ktedonobacteraceae bacterium]
MRLQNSDLFVAVLIAALNVLWAFLPNHPLFISTILALPLVFVIPGYTLTHALFYNRLLDTPRRLAFSFGFSLVIDILSGLLLNLLPMGLHALSWAIFLAFLTTAFSLLVIYLRRRTSFKKASAPTLRFTIFDGILLGLATLVAILSVLYSIIGAAQQPYPGFTQLWMLPQVRTGKSCAVQLGMQSFESTSTTYRITMTTNGGQATSWSSIVLAPQQKWQHLVPIAPEAIDTIYVEAQLYRLDKPQTVYRSVHITLPNAIESTNGKARVCGTP